MITTAARGRILSALMTAAVCCTVVGCGSASAPSTPSPSSARGASAEPAGSDVAAPIDACSLIAAADVSALLGVTVDGVSTATAEQPGCYWENPESSESISLEIGAPDTAINDTVPPPEDGFPEVRTPGPDGMMFYGPGAVEFAAGHRSNTVTVSVLRMLGEEADAAAVDLARKVTAQL